VVAHYPFDEYAIFFVSLPRKEVMNRDIIDSLPVWKPTVRSGHDLQMEILSSSAYLRGHQGQVTIERIYLNPKVEEEEP
jgi:hypothetical protein